MSKTPPHSIEAEQSILGGLLLDREAIDQVADLISSDDFYKPSHQKLYGAVKELHAQNSPVDIITITNLLQSRQQLQDIGGPEYLVSLLDRTISAAHIISHAKIVREKALLRRLIKTHSDLIEKAYNQDFVDVDSFIDQAEAEVFKVGESQSQGKLTSSMDVVKVSIQKIEELYKKKADITGLATGFSELDRLTSGLHPGELTIIAARPSMGKTAFSLNIAQHIAVQQKKTVAYFSLEMGKESMMMRLLASEAKISLSEIRNGRIQDHAWPKLIQSASLISESPLYLDDSSGISPFEIRARCRRLKAEKGLDAIMIDYLQLMDLKQKVESRERAVSEISRSLKAIAKELRVPVIALAQLNRGVEGRSDRRPMLSDLRESGSIEQDADVIMMLYRDDYYDKEDPEKQGQAEVIVGKQRNGATGTVKLRFEAKFNKFKDAEPMQNSPLPPPPPMSSPGMGSGGRPRNFANA